MALNFPHETEVQLERSPLVEVVCQVRFPPILRITKEEPSDFQERIRGRFPELELEQGILVEFAGLGSESMPTAKVPPKLYRFRTRDGQTTVSLAVDFFALSTHYYTYWADFARDLELVYGAFRNVYGNSYSTRIGLRYVNRLSLSKTNLQSADELLDLIRPELTAQLHTDAWNQPVDMLGQLLLADGELKLALRTTFGTEADGPFFLLDFDCFEEGKLELGNLLERCDRYHQIIYDAFRWCLRGNRIEVFGPMLREVSNHD